MKTPVRIGAMRVDLEALLSIAHRCRPERCRARRHCCASYEVCATEDEIPRIVGGLKAATAYCGLPRDDLEELNIFDPVGDGDFAIDVDDNERCVLAYRDRAGVTRCALHSAALELGLPPYQSKPRSCSLWPLAMSEGRVPCLSVMDDAFRFPCNRRRSGSPRRLHRGIAAILEDVFGAAFLADVEAAVARRS